jgi:hypothetical protein
VTPSFSSSFRVSLPHFNDNSSSITQPEKEQRKQKLKTKQEKPRIRKRTEEYQTWTRENPQLHV